MSVKIRLMRLGKVKSPFYRMVVIDGRKSGVSQYLEQVGSYAPMEKDPSKSLTLKNDEITKWINKGAQPSEVVRKLLTSAKFVWPVLSTNEKATAAAKAKPAKKKASRKSRNNPIAQRVKKEKKVKKLAPPKKKKKAPKAAT